MAQQTSNWWFTSYVADQFDRCRVEANRYGHRMVLFGRKDRLKFHVAVQRLATGNVDAAHGSSELSIRIGRDILLQKIYQAAIALQQSQHLHRSIGRFRHQFVTCNLLSLGRCPCCDRFDLCIRSCQRPHYVLRDLPLKQQREKTTKGKRQPC